MAKKKGAPSPVKVVAQKRELTISEQMETAANVRSETDAMEAKYRKHLAIRKLFEDVKSFFDLSQAESEKLELWKTDGGYFISYDDIRVFPESGRVVRLIWECPKCGMPTSSATPCPSMETLGEAIKVAKAGKFRPVGDHVCD